MSEQFSLGTFFPAVHPQGRIFVLGAFLIAVLSFVLLPDIFGWLGLLLTLFCCFFFRDPDRRVPNLPDVLVSPADGRICAVKQAPWPKELGGDGSDMRTRISIFLSVMDVHVNRTPAAGRVRQIAYVPGSMVNANLDKASEDNERNLVALERSDGSDLAFVQISGFVARRIVCEIEEGDEVEAGARFGLIRFGSRMDVYLPAGFQPAVSMGQITIGGETILAQPGGSKDPIAATQR